MFVFHDIVKVPSQIYIQTNLRASRSELNILRQIIKHINDNIENNEIHSVYVLCIHPIHPTDQTSSGKTEQLCNSFRSKIDCFTFPY